MAKAIWLLLLFDRRNFVSEGKRARTPERKRRKSAYQRRWRCALNRSPSVAKKKIECKTYIYVIIVDSFRMCVREDAKRAKIREKELIDRCRFDCRRRHCLRSFVRSSSPHRHRWPSATWLKVSSSDVERRLRWAKRKKWTQNKIIVCSFQSIQKWMLCFDRVDYIWFADVRWRWFLCASTWLLHFYFDANILCCRGAVIAISYFFFFRSFVCFSPRVFHSFIVSVSSLVLGSIFVCWFSFTHLFVVCFNHLRYLFFSFILCTFWHGQRACHDCNRLCLPSSSS